MKCPLFFIGRTAVIPREGAEIGSCLLAECAWWDAPVERCLWQNVSEKLSLIYRQLNDIAKELTLIRPK